MLAIAAVTYGSPDSAHFDCLFPWYDIKNKEPFGAIGAAVASEFPTFGILSLGTPNAWASDAVLKDTTADRAKS